MKTEKNVCVKGRNDQKGQDVHGLTSGEPDYSIFELILIHFFDNLISHQYLFIFINFAGNIIFSKKYLEISKIFFIFKDRYT